MKTIQLNKVFLFALVSFSVHMTAAQAAAPTQAAQKVKILNTVAPADKVEPAQIRLAEIGRIEEVAKTCLKSSKGDAGDRECEGAQFESLEKFLNTTYNEVVAQLKKAAQCQVKKGEFLSPVREDSSKTRSQEILARLLSSERAWVKYRESECHLESSGSLEGSAEGIVETRCLSRFTKERVKKFNEVFDEEAYMCGTNGL